MKIAYVHILPLEYYPPASNFLEILARLDTAEVRVFTMADRKGRAPFTNARIAVERSPSPDPAAPPTESFSLFYCHEDTSMELSWTRERPDGPSFVGCAASM